MNPSACRHVDLREEQYRDVLAALIAQRALRTWDGRNWNELYGLIGHFATGDEELTARAALIITKTHTKQEQA